jgi:hypothetical protein
MAAPEMTVKNTFLDLVELIEEPEGKRSHSVPRSWKPACPEPCRPLRSAPRWADSADDFTEHTSCGVTFLVSDSSTVDSDHDCQVSSSSEDITPGHSGEKVTLSLCSTIVQERTKLKSKAKIFEPVSSLPRDMHCVLMAAQAALSSSPNILNVQMCDGRLGGITTIIGSYARGSLQVFELMKTLTIVKTLLLDAAANTENTYVMGYVSDPFTDIGQSGFSTKLASVPAEQEASTCWDCYQKGFCPRRSTCRWCHPLDSNLANVVVMLNEVDQLAQCEALICVVPQC